MEPESVPTTIHLPIEVWEKVFQHSEAKDAWNFRLVCKAWRKELDNHFDKWDVHLDQRCRYFQVFLQLKVKKATVLDLSTPVDMGQEIGSPKLFKHPELVEKLSIPDDSHIRPENLLLLLNSCGKTIKHLDIAVRFYAGVLTDPSYNLHPNGFEFPNLESLNLDFASCPRRPVEQLTLFKLMVGLSTMSKIKSLTLSIRNRRINVVSSAILTFIGKNGRNLEDIECRVILNSANEDSVPPIDLALLRQVRRLRNLRIHYQGRLCEPSSEIVEGWSTLLEEQRNLTDLDLNGLPISRRNLRLVCHNNQNTLTKIELRCLDFEIDLAVLAGCTSLKELRLETFFGGPALRNARSLPIGIQNFESRNYCIESRDILDFFNGHGELVEIRLDFSGCSGAYGVSTAMFDHFVINRDLTNKLRKVWICGFNCWTAEDRTALNEIFRGLAEVWEDKQGFYEVVIRMDRVRGEEGDWSGWGIRTGHYGTETDYSF